MLTIEPHPLLELQGFVTRFPRPLGEVAPVSGVLELLSPNAQAPLRSDDQVRKNAAVDAGNAVSLHSGLPISVVDLGRAREPLGVGIAAPGSAFVFNASGQTIDVGGLLCLHDAEGPCATIEDLLLE